VRVNEFLTVAELAELIDVPANQIIGSAFKNLGMMVTINQRLDFDQIELLLDEFGFRAVREEEYGSELQDEHVADTPENLVWRPPVVTVMGHVDHGQDVAARLHPEDQRDCRRIGRITQAHWRVSRAALRTAGQSRSSIPRATPPSRPCAPAAPR